MKTALIFAAILSPGLVLASTVVQQATSHILPALEPLFRALGY